MGKKKSLQKFTEFEEITSVNEVKEFIIQRPKQVEELITFLIKEINDSYTKKLGKEYNLINMIAECYKFSRSDEKVIEFRNVTYETNHAVITNCIHNWICERKNMPIMNNIAEDTGLSRQTIYKHLKNGLFSKYNSLARGGLELMTTQALTKLYMIGIDDRNATALKYFIELSGGIKKQDKFIDTNNYIQINHINLSKEEFSQIPHDTMFEIEQLISKDLKTIKPTIIKREDH